MDKLCQLTVLRITTGRCAVADKPRDACANIVLFVGGLSNDMLKHRYDAIRHVSLDEDELTVSSAYSIRITAVVPLTKKRVINKQQRLHFLPVSRFLADRVYIYCGRVYATDYSVASVCRLSVRNVHCVQKKTPTHIFFHISMSDV